MSNQSRSAQSFCLPPDASIAEIRSLHNELLRIFDRPGHIEIDGSAVSKADVTSIQLLLSALKAGQLQDRKIKLTDVSPYLASVFERAGLRLASDAGESLPQSTS